MRVGSRSCSTGDDGDGETRPNSRGLRGGCGPTHRRWQTVAAVEEFDEVPSFSVAVGGREASREGRWRRERIMWAWMRGTG
jgi:hypothetical protein